MLKLTWERKYLQQSQTKKEQGKTRTRRNVTKIDHLPSLTIEVKDENEN